MGASNGLDIVVAKNSYKAAHSSTENCLIELDSLKIFKKKFLETDKRTCP